jgi:Ala-tRNA(Pro) deacylase
MNSEEKVKQKNQITAADPASLTESGLPGGGQGRCEEVGHSGVYRVSDALAPGDALVRTLPQWGQGARGAAGYFDHGESGVWYIPPPTNSASLPTGKFTTFSCRERLEAYLQENEIAYQRQHHPKAFTAEEVAESEHLPGQKMAKVVMVIAEGNLVMLVLPASEVVNLDRLVQILDVSEVRLASEEEFVPVFLDCEAGAMPPFGNLYDLPVYVDTKLAEQDVIVFQAGTATETISLKFRDFVRLVQPIVATFRWEVD